MRSNNRRRWGAGIRTFVALVAVGVAACDKQQIQIAVDSALIAEDISGALQECPQSWYKFLKDRRGSLTQFSLPDRTTDVPEFHDCQKFLVGDATTYGPLVAIFSAWELDRITARLDSAAGYMPEAKPVTGQPAADARPTRPPVPAPPVGREASGGGGAAQAPVRGGGGAGPFGLATALIVNLGDRYRVDDFIIEPGYSCLYMWRIPGGDWGAKIFHVPNEKLCMVQRDNITASGTG